MLHLLSYSYGNTSTLNRGRSSDVTSFMNIINSIQLLEDPFRGGHLDRTVQVLPPFKCLSPIFTVKLDNMLLCLPQSPCSIFAHSCTGSTAFFNAYFGRGTGHILLDDLLCNGSETRLIDCPRFSSQGIGTYDFCQNGHGEDAGVRCVDSK